MPRAKNTSPNRGAASELGRISPKRAGTPGQTVYDASGNEVTAPDTQFIGASVSGEDGELAIVTITGTGQQVINDAGVELNYGDVVVLAVDGTVTTTTTERDTRPVGVVQVGGPVGGPVHVQFAGFVDQLNTTGTVAQGDYLETSASAGDAQSSGVSRRIGSFAHALADGPNPPALLYGAPDAAGSGTGGAETVVDHGNMGATETIDAAVGTWHRGTLNANCAIAVTGFTADEAVVMVVKIEQNGAGGYAITWDADVVFVGTDQPAQAATSVTYYVLWSDEGDATVYGARVGAASLTIQEEGVSLATAAETLNFVGTGVTASGTGATKTITITASATLDDLTDVTITSPATGDRLRYNGSAWVNSAMRWEPHVDYTGSVVLDGNGDPVMVEVA